MVMLVICSSMMSSTSMVMLKMLGELVQSAGWQEYWLLNLIMVTMLAVGGALQLHSLNVAMKFYD